MNKFRLNTYFLSKINFGNKKNLCIHSGFQKTKYSGFFLFGIRTICELSSLCSAFPRGTGTYIYVYMTVRELQR